LIKYINKVHRRIIDRNSFSCSTSHGSTAPSEPGFHHYRGFTIILRHTTFGRTPLEEWLAQRTDLYPTTHNTHNRQTSIPLAGFEPTVQARELPHSDALDVKIMHVVNFQDIDEKNTWRKITLNGYLILGGVLFE
jgi:hypothetical protein